MAENFGPGVSRTLSAFQKQFQQLVWQADKPPLDSEMNLMGQIEMDRMQQLVRSQMPSGFVTNPIQSDRDFETSANWSNWFKFGSSQRVAYANVNGWIIPVTGTGLADDLSNRINLFPPPSSDSRIDFVFLEVWRTLIAPNPSALNKPSPSMLWRYGNVRFGGTNVPDDLEDPEVGLETTKRVQIQYRLRVVGQGSGLGTSVDMATYPDGLDDPNVLGQGANGNPVAGFTFANMGDDLGDPGLWRSGDGDPNNSLGTVDGYTYAVPVAAIFRRNTSNYTSRNTAGNPNQNGALNRNPVPFAIIDPVEGTATFDTPSLTNTIASTTTGVVQVDNLANSALANPSLDWDSVFLMLGNEIVSISGVDVGAGTITIRASNGRGRAGSMAVPHIAGTEIKFYVHRLDGLFADQITPTDILDLRRSVTLGEWDYHQILAHNLSKLLRGELRTSYKQGGIGDTQGPLVVEVDTLLANGPIPNFTEALDGPDGIRTVFSDAATLQSDVTMLLDDPSAGPGDVGQIDLGLNWDIGAPLVPTVFANGSGWSDGTIIWVHIGGATGANGARETFRDSSERPVRFVTPKEFYNNFDENPDQGNQTPITFRFVNEKAHIPAAGSEDVVRHPGSFHPLRNLGFEYPFLVLGGLLNANSRHEGSVEVFPESAPGAGDWEIAITGEDFDAAGDWFSKTSGVFDDDPDAISKPVLHGNRTLWSLLTNDGQDETGASSEAYLVLWGDTSNPQNNGVFRIVGAGDTAGYTQRSATAANRLRVEFISGSYSDFASATGLNAEIRSMYTSSLDGQGAASQQAAMAVVLTDVEGTQGGTANPWNSANLAGNAISQPVNSRAVLSTSILYHPGRGGTARVPDSLQRVATVAAGPGFLRQAPTTRDGTFAAQAGVPNGETYFDINPIQTWNRLSSKGLHAPHAPAYGGGVVSFTEQDREAEVFVDLGSKTLMFRPYLNRSMTLRRTTVSDGALIPASWGSSIPSDPLGMFASGRTTGYSLPHEVMPRFGRQDIPVHDGETGAFLFGVNHLFTDSVAVAEPQFNVVGGVPTTLGVPNVNTVRFQTGDTSLSYGQYGQIPGVTAAGKDQAFQARIFNDPVVQSSDVGRGLEGIQLPPFYGVARIYGIYDARDYVDSNGDGFAADRVTPGSTPNLIRKDATKQTLFLVQGGAEDVTGNGDDHTYVIPKDLIDIRLSDSYVEGEAFSDIEFVVECVVFGFSRGWINKNNYVLARQLNGQGATALEDLEGAQMVFPAASDGVQLYTAYVRTPYQGDPYMTRAGETRTVSDYEHRYGQIASADAFGLSEPIQQFDLDGNIIPEIPNARPLQVLASVDFYTTLGTGKIGGDVFPGTVLDVGHVVNNPQAATRIPKDADEGPFQVLPRAFTEGQFKTDNRASIRLLISDNASLTGTDLRLFFNSSTATNVTYAPGVDASASAVALANAINTSVTTSAFVEAYPLGAVLEVVSKAPGDEGNAYQLEVDNPTAMVILSVSPGSIPLRANTRSFFQGGDRFCANASAMPEATTPLKLTGITERLPLGILVQDSDFIGEDPLRDGTSALQSAFGVVNSGSNVPVPLVESQEYTRLIGGTGQFLGMADGAILQYIPYNENASPTGSRRFRLYRGGGSAYMLSDPIPGGPVDWSAGSFPSALKPVLKGGVLAGKALLVRNYSEQAFTANNQVSYGGEIQMVILTQAIFGKGTEHTSSVSLTGTISPTGYGEGYAAADRYRLEGKPLIAGSVSEPPDPDVDLALFPFDNLTVKSGC